MGSYTFIDKEFILEGKLEGEITLLENLYQQGILSKTQYAEMIEPLRRKQLKHMSDAVP